MQQQMNISSRNILTNLTAVLPSSSSSSSSSSSLVVSHCRAVAVFNIGASSSFIFITKLTAVIHTEQHDITAAAAAAASYMPILYCQPTIAVKKWRSLLQQSFTVYTHLLRATSTHGFVTPPQQ